MDILKAVALSVAVSGVAATAPAFVLQDAAGQFWALKDHLGRERLLIVSQPSAAYLAEVRRQNVALQVRDLRVVALLHSGDARLNGPQTLTLTLLADSAGTVAQQYGPAALIGKDGGVKARYAAPPALNIVLGLVDGMPMRQQERRERGK
ncbi:DUF4174 domain-containing protein [Deinococcus detaillensis]|uniref:DUF4174 domain-containing protein n=1 Tax=Deinococcus detaillensis TaxID=2592048 RepID=A0A553UFG8_9DEIO|nr:DUF4174 domain-containing protein [Deinococcus detaillensis]TSA78952.1 DUF4174 domain-containing protein [Deinococcus detaillensis]